MTLWDLDDRAGIARVGDHWHPRRVPGLHPAGQVHGVVTALEQGRSGPLGAATNSTDGHDGPVLVELVEAGGQGRERNVQGIGGVTGVPLVGLPHVEQHSAFIDAPRRLFGADGGYGRLALHTPTL